MNRFLKTAVSAALLFAVTASCMKKPDLSEDDGDAVPASVVQASLLKAWGNGDSADIKLNEFTATDVTVTLADLPAYTTLQDSKEIIASKESSDGLSNILTVHHHVVENAGGAQKPSDEQFDIKVAKPTLATDSVRVMDESGEKAAAGTPITPFSIEFMLALMDLCQGADGSCHKLKTWQETIAPPGPIAARPGCEGLPNCKMKINGVSFDYITEVRDPDTGVNTRVKQRVSAKISPDSPILSKIFELCLAGVQNQNGALYPATTCYKITNFRRGTSAP